MPQSTTTGATPKQSSGVNPLSMLLHLGKTFALTGAVLSDRRVHWLPKFAFIGLIGALMAGLLFPEMAVDVLGVIPTAGLDLLGIPAEAGIDWMVFGVAAFNLLKLFPADIVGEHYDRLFRSK
jgi:hypothetical protein